MHERMLDKKIVPTEDEIKKYIGEKSVENMESLLNSLKKYLKLI
jgi:hypothetical protein